MFEKKKCSVSELNTKYKVLLKHKQKLLPKYKVHLLEQIQNKPTQRYQDDIILNNT